MTPRPCYKFEISTSSDKSPKQLKHDFDKSYTFELQQNHCGTMWFCQTHLNFQHEQKWFGFSSQKKKRQYQNYNI